MIYKRHHQSVTRGEIAVRPKLTELWSIPTKHFTKVFPYKYCSRRAKIVPDKNQSSRWGWVSGSFARLVVDLISKIQFPHTISVADAICGTRFDLRDSKRRALENYFGVRICYMFQISKCKGDWDLGLCTTSVLALGEPKRNGKIRFSLRWNRLRSSDFVIAHSFSKRKYRSCAHT